MNTEKIASTLAIRSVQLDLARQMETIAFIKDFTDFIAANGYNSLTLYLEGRIRTASFPYPAAEESYSPDQIREIVGYATDQGIEVIPVISTLSHAALFLQHSALAFLAENRPPFSGRFPGDYRHVFCPSQPETYEFFRAYLGEITPLFPSAYFHAGCDEAWDIGLCDLCQKRLSRGETQADLFARHLEETHTILTGGLSKRMIIWDDMFENYPEALERLPRDVVLAHWQYQGNVGPSRAHFSNRRMENSPAKYHRPISNIHGPKINYAGFLSALADVVDHPIPLLVEVRSREDALLSWKTLNDFLAGIQDALTAKQSQPSHSFGITAPRP